MVKASVFGIMALLLKVANAQLAAAIAHQIAGKLSQELKGAFWGTVDENEKAAHKDGLEITDNKEINGGTDGARTRDLQRDRLAF
jgi:hypothetical protein